MDFILKRLSCLEDIDLNGANELWRASDAAGDNTDPEDYDADALSMYIKDPANIIVACFVDDKPVGFVLATVVKKPYKDKDFLYIDEVDVHAEYRKKGIGTALLKETFRIARDEYGLHEAWLGTEPDNTPARALYESLNPTETEPTIGYTFEV